MMVGSFTILTFILFCLLGGLPGELEGLSEELGGYLSEGLSGRGGHKRDARLVGLESGKRELRGLGPGQGRLGGLISSGQGKDVQVAGGGRRLVCPYCQQKCLCKCVCSYCVNKIYTEPTSKKCDCS